VIERVSAENLCKTGISADKAGDFRQFRARDREFGSLETKSNAGKARIFGPVTRKLQTVANRTNAGLEREGSNPRMAESKSSAGTKLGCRDWI
jgi:hypothetical protein